MRGVCGCDTWLAAKVSPKWCRIEALLVSDASYVKFLSTAILYNGYIRLEISTSNKVKSYSNEFFKEIVIQVIFIRLAVKSVLNEILKCFFLYLGIAIIYIQHLIKPHSKDHRCAHNLNAF